MVSRTHHTQVSRKATPFYFPPTPRSHSYPDISFTSHICARFVPLILYVSPLRALLSLLGVMPIEYFPTWMMKAGGYVFLPFTTRLYAVLLFLHRALRCGTVGDAVLRCKQQGHAILSRLHCSDITWASSGTAITVTIYGITAGFALYGLAKRIQS